MFASLKREERKEKSVSCSKSISPRKGKKKTIQHRGGAFCSFTKIFEKKAKRGIFLSLSFLSKFSPSQSNKRANSLNRSIARRGKFSSRAHLRESQREGERERQSHPVVGAINSLSLPLSLSFSFLFFSLPQTKKNKIKRSHGGGKDFLPSSFAPFCASSLSFSLSLPLLC